MTEYTSTQTAMAGFLSDEQRQRRLAMDAETKHDPSNGQFTSGGGSTSHKAGRNNKSQEHRILHESPDKTHYVMKHPKGFYEVYKNGPTVATRVASIGEGPGPNLGLSRAISEANKRSKSKSEGG